MHTTPHAGRSAARLKGRCGVLLVASVLSTGTFAQRADVNVVAEADDAFGYESAGESIGLYDAWSVRGFSPSRAGNVRVEGLYFDWQAKFTDEVVDSVRIDVGLNAAARPFASPSGIADYQLKHADGKSADVSVALGPFDARRIALEAGHRTTDGAAGLHVGIASDWASSGAGSKGRESGLGLVADFRPADGIQATVFLDRQRYWRSYTDPYFFVSGTHLPRELPRRETLTQDWARENGSNDNQGIVFALDLSDTLELRAGLFQSRWQPTRSFDTFILDADRPDSARQWIATSIDGDRASTSGELRLAHAWRIGATDQRGTWSLRGRDLARRYGGDVESDLGPVIPGEYAPVAPPALNYGPQDRADLRQVGVGYDHRTRWSRRFETNAGLQWVDASNGLRTASTPRVGSGASTLLRSLGAHFAITDAWLAFANYTEGSESLGTAPAVATNPNELLPEVRSTQREIGVRYRAGDVITLQANAFRLRRPHADFDATGAFRSIGNLDNRGIEVSVRSRPTQRLTLLGGLLWMDAVVEGAIARASRRPAGVPGRQALLYADYLLSPARGMSIEASVTHHGDALVDAQTGLTAPSRTNASAGIRWLLGERDHPLALRFGIDNVFDGYGWIVDRSGGLQYTPPRSVSLSINRHF